MKGSILKHKTSPKKLFVIVIDENETEYSVVVLHEESSETAGDMTKFLKSELEMSSFLEISDYLSGT